MDPKTLRFVRLTLATLGTLLVLSGAAVAGPPLVCHPFDIGNAKSLPWISHDWNLTGGENFDINNLTRETLAILDETQVPLVHMETLRRATLYARKDPAAAKQLLLKLVARAQNNESADHPNPLAFFDAAYLTEAYKQWLGEKGQNPANGLDGHTWTKKATELRPSDPQLAFGAALITLSGPGAEQVAYAERAIAGAKQDELLARNLESHFLGSESQTMSEMILQTGSNHGARKVAKQ
jgi:hypothetical protein